jgi:hypothetical protein
LKYLINEDIIEIPVNKIKEYVLSFRKDRQLTIRRSNLSSLEYPIISKDINGNYNMILDGHHRLLKAINNNIETIKARVLDLSTAPKLYQSMVIKNKKKSNYLNDKKVRQIYYRVFVRNYDIKANITYKNDFRDVLTSLKKKRSRL